MLYDPRLDVFLACAAQGSFSRASEQLSMTSTGILKQISQLEYDLETRLFNRTHRGLELTEAGLQLQSEAMKLKSFCQAAMERVYAADCGLGREIRIGISPLTPPALMADLWPKIQPIIPDLRFQLIPFENNQQQAQKILSSLGEGIDVVPGLFDASFLETRQCAGLEVCPCSIQIGVPFGHPFWGRSELELDEMKGQRIHIIHAGWSGVTDRLREQLRQAGAQIVDLEYFSSEVLLQAVNSQQLVIAFSIWKGINPLLDLVDAKWAGTMSYGFLHNPHPDGGTSRFLEAIRKTADGSS